MNENAQQKLSVNEAINELKKLIESENGIEKIDYIEGDEFSHETEEGKKLHYKTIKLRDEYKENLFYVDNPEEFFYRVRDEFNDILSVFAVGSEYVSFELEVKKTKINSYNIIYYIKLGLYKKEGKVSMLRYIEIKKITETKANRKQ